MQTAASYSALRTHFVREVSIALGLSVVTGGVWKMFHRNHNRNVDTINHEWQKTKAENAKRAASA
eukprot:CAMPEP_0197452094 /NCGR_PEP_ID=MMETSP1175-20131217/31102_1 /TAXON_ID=1003142 /ORGANISM="Triceratium dubium, Strain CCMP147" /LENGTH=64 /DNA_ID=CAMNT_0042985005 /DNA_START=44 /DNA_END=238 /DNA_ORIENTATION=+